jgi:hypothetical protein
MANKRMNYLNNNHSQKNNLEVFRHRSMPHGICRPGATLHGMVKWFRIVVRFPIAVGTSTIWIKNLQNILSMNKKNVQRKLHPSGSHIISHTTLNPSQTCQTVP